jgi:regulator of protease activity HflC (stomatin/prohibitin superfamily)
MSETTAEAPAVEDDGSAREAKPDQSFTQADVDRIVADRLKRERDKVGDVKVLRAAADELATIKEAQKSDAQKVSDRLAEAEKATAEAKSEALRYRIASKFAIGDEDAALFLTGTDEDVLTKQAERLTARESERKKTGNYVPREGTTPTTSGSDGRDTARALFGGN